MVANDEFAPVERLTQGRDGSYAGHEIMHLAEVFDLPEGADGEMDIEGLDIADGYLWVVGSHSLTREKPKPGEHDPDAALARLTEVKQHPNRHFLGRLPLVESAPGSGLFALRPRAGNGKRGTTRRSGCLKMKAERNALTRALDGDVHIARFMRVPAKENGFDIEGIAARGDRVFLGLRGPVLRGWATSWGRSCICPTAAAKIMLKDCAGCPAVSARTSCSWSTTCPPAIACTRAARSMPTSSGSRAAAPPGRAAGPRDLEEA